MDETIETTGGLEASDAAAGAVAKTVNRVTLDQLKEKVRRFAFVNPELTPLLTLCVIELQNGFVVVGKSAAADPDNFNAELGRKIAYEDALSQVWPLEGYLLRERLYWDQQGSEMKAAAQPIDIQSVDEIPADPPADEPTVQAEAAVSPHLARMGGQTVQEVASAVAGPPVEAAPSVGRIVHVRFSDARSEGEHFAAIITGVRNETLVDLTVFPRAGSPSPISFVEQGDDPAAVPIDGDATSGVCWQWPARA
ncbi:Gp49 family protein [Hyphomonas sp.]|jgi:hypothetical protein|uniref:Gp49 family protein n=1 Tax=Hyphomonas sp. TaxID=87 RepID=UPI0032EB1A3E